MNCTLSVSLRDFLKRGTMHRDLRHPDVDSANQGPRTRKEPGAFANSLLSSSAPKSGSPVAEGVEEHKLLANLARYSARHAEKLRNLREAEARNRRQRENLEWCAKFSTKSEKKLRKEEAEARGGRPRAEPFSRMLFEADWDPSKHPRVPAGQPGGGQWTKSGEGAPASPKAKLAGASKTAHPTAEARARLPLPKGKGHHWTTLAALQQPDVRPFLSRDAKLYALGSLSGPTVPPHGNQTINGVPHTDYTEALKEELPKFIKLKKVSESNKMTAEQMEELVGLIKDGKGAYGQELPKIADFNRGVRERVIPGFRQPKTMEEVLALGRKIAKQRAFRLMIAGAAVSFGVGELVAQEIGMLNVAANSNNYRKAIAALDRGDLNMAQKHLTDDPDSLYIEIAERVSATAALNFKGAIDRAFENARAIQDDEGGL
ncbi:MAG: hypothetical protein ACT4QC_19810 [Planctomycetaceae bacterium]